MSLSSLYTLCAQSSEGSNNLAIYYRINTSKATSGTNKLGESAYAFFIAVWISYSVKYWKGSMSFTDFTNIL